MSCHVRSYRENRGNAIKIEYSEVLLLDVQPLPRIACSKQEFFILR